MANENALLLWEDIETSGLHLTKDHILEVAFVLTDTDFNELGSFERVIAPRGSKPRVELVREVYADSHPVVQDMHTTNGLWADVSHNGSSLEAVAWDAAAWCKELCEDRTPLLAGASLHALDWPMLQRDFRELSSLLHYRAFDISSLKRMYEWWYPPMLPAPHTLLEALPNMAAHRAMADCRFAIAEAKLICEHIKSLVP